MLAFIYALIPVILIVATGRFMAWREMIAPAGWRGIERISYVLLFPALIIREIANAPLETAPWGLAIALVGAQVGLFLIGLLARARGGLPAKGSIIQSNVRWTAFVALSIAGALFGSEGLALVAISAALMIPFANIFSVGALIKYGDSEFSDTPGYRPNIARGLATNPLILACIIGTGLNLTGLAPTGVADETLRLMGQAVIALGLLTAGAGVDFSALRGAGVRTVQWSLIRLLGLPLLALGLGLWIGLPTMHLLVAVICTASPTATNGYILARQLGGNAPLSANLIAVQTVLSIVTMPLIYMLALNLSGSL
jgi:predicted permease